MMFQSRFLAILALVFASSCLATSSERSKPPGGRHVSFAANPGSANDNNDLLLRISRRYAEDRQARRDDGHLLTQGGCLSSTATAPERRTEGGSPSTMEMDVEQAEETQDSVPPKSPHLRYETFPRMQGRRATESLSPVRAHVKTMYQRARNCVSSGVHGLFPSSGAATDVDHGEASRDASVPRTSVDGPPRAPEQSAQFTSRYVTLSSQASRSSSNPSAVKQFVPDRCVRWCRTRWEECFGDGARWRRCLENRGGVRPETRWPRED